MLNKFFYIQNGNSKVNVKHTLSSGVYSNVAVANGYYYYIQQDRLRVVKLKTDFSEEIISDLHPDDKTLISVSVPWQNRVFCDTTRYSGTVSGVLVNEITDLNFTRIANYGSRTNLIRDYCIFNDMLVVNPYEFVHTYDGSTYQYISGTRGGRTVISFQNKLYRIQQSQNIGVNVYDGTSWSFIAGTENITYYYMTATDDYLFLFRPDEIYRYDGSTLELYISFTGNAHHPRWPSNIVAMDNKVFFINSINRTLNFFYDDLAKLYSIQTPFSSGDIIIVNLLSKIELWDITNNIIYDINSMHDLFNVPTGYGIVTHQGKKVKDNGKYIISQNP